MSSMSPSTIWMGDLEPYMHEMFIITAFEQMGVEVKKVKMIRKNESAAPYCFVDLTDEKTALHTMLKLNNKIIPMTNPPVRFKLNHASYGREHLSVPEYSLFVKDLTEDVDDYKLFETFASRYSSVRNAKVVYFKEGTSRGYGFVRFTAEQERTNALKEMQNFKGLGSKKIQLSLAAPKTKQSYSYQYSAGDPYAAYYNQQYYGYSAWPTYSASSGYGYNTSYSEDGYYGAADYSQYHNSGYNAYALTPPDDDEELVDPNEDVNIAEQNKLFMNRSEELYTALANSKWIPVDSVITKLTAQILS